MKLTAFRKGSSVALLMETASSRALFDCPSGMFQMLQERGCDPRSLTHILLTYGDDGRSAWLIEFLQQVDPPNPCVVLASPRVVAKVKKALPGRTQLALTPIESIVSICIGDAKAMCFQVPLGCCRHCAANMDFLSVYQVKGESGKGFVYIGNRWPRKNGSGSHFSAEARELLRSFGESAPTLICDAVGRSEKDIFALMPEAAEAGLVLLPNGTLFTNGRHGGRFARALPPGRARLAQHGVTFEL